MPLNLNNLKAAIMNNSLNRHLIVAWIEDILASGLLTKSEQKQYKKQLAQILGEAGETTSDQKLKPLEVEKSK